ncbi:MAG: class II glutamine amidotransferase [Vulcanisaeta sp.]
MCRMVLSIGFTNDEKVLVGVVDSLVKAASQDPYGKDLYGEEQHKDGWGLLAIKFVDASMSVLHYRNTRPIFEDDAVDIVRSFFNDYRGMYLLMVHARAASTGTPINVFSTHPVRATTRSGSELYMIHNGSFNRDFIIKELNFSREIASMYNDTYIANLALAGRASNDVNRDDLAWLLNYVKTGANLGISLVNSDNVVFIVGSYYKLMNDGKDEVRERYYRFYYCRNNGQVMYASSTVIDHYRPREFADCMVMRNGEYHKYLVNASRFEMKESWLFQ